MTQCQHHRSVRLHCGMGVVLLLHAKYLIPSAAVSQCQHTCNGWGEMEKYVTRGRYYVTRMQRDDVTLSVVISEWTFTSTKMIV